MPTKKTTTTVIKEKEETKPKNDVLGQVRDIADANKNAGRGVMADALNRIVKLIDG